jgi:hypothetical protein
MGLNPVRPLSRRQSGAWTEFQACFRMSVPRTKHGKPLDLGISVQGSVDYRRRLEPKCLNQAVSVFVRGTLMRKQA